MPGFVETRSAISYKLWRPQEAGFLAVQHNEMDFFMMYPDDGHSLKR